MSTVTRWFSEITTESANDVLTFQFPTRDIDPADALQGEARIKEPIRRVVVRNERAAIAEMQGDIGCPASACRIGEESDAQENRGRG